ncbi:unnamed protein product [Oreochromis niloticus]|nr:unnamed protein product [Mustela putorius furo]
MMSRPQKYIEGEAFDSQREKSNNALKLRVAVLVVCVLLVSALMVTYLYEPCYKCEDDWKEHGGNCYYFSTNSSSWNESRTVCKSKGGDLVKIDSEEEQNFLRKNVQQKMEIHDIPFWIGLTDLAEEGRWLWVDGSPLNESLTFWNFFEPDDWKGKDPDREDCERMGSVYWPYSQLLKEGSAAAGFLHVLRKNNLDQKLLAFNCSSVERMLSYSLGVWYSGANTENRKAALRVISTAITRSFCHRKTRAITGESLQSAHHLFDPLPCGRCLR